MKFAEMCYGWEKQEVQPDSGCETSW